MFDIFISYSRKDRAFASRLHEALKARQQEAWVDLEDIPPTAAWREKITVGIEGARAFVFVLSPDSMSYPGVPAEVEYAVASHKRLIPAVFREVEPQAAPKALSRLNWIFLRDQDDFDKNSVAHPSGTPDVFR